MLFNMSSANLISLIFVLVVTFTHHAGSLKVTAAGRAGATNNGKSDGSDKDTELLWSGYKETYNKQFKDKAEDSFRRKIYESNVKYINEHNTKAEQGLYSFTLGVNKFADLTGDDMKNYFLTLQVPANYIEAKTEPLEKRHDVPVDSPTSVDWRDKYVTPVKDQGQCGSCWAFSATGALEGQWANKTGQLVSLSEQNLMDCSSTYGNAGCSGGWMVNAYQYVKANGGLDSEATYPYMATDGHACKYNSLNAAANCTGYVGITRGNESALMTAVATVGPVAVAIDAGRPSFQFYKSGVYNEASCSSTSLNHGVLAVGYGQEVNGVKYWIVKNSWGLGWGAKGYIMMSKDNKNQCGIATAASYPTVSV